MLPSIAPGKSGVSRVRPPCGFPPGVLGVVAGEALGDVEVGAGLGVEEADHLGARLDVRAHQPLLQNVPGQRHDVGDGLFCAVRDADPGHERVVRDPDVAARRAAKALPGTSGETEAPFAAAVWPVRVALPDLPA
jgi:hypothetical protein